MSASREVIAEALSVPVEDVKCSKCARCRNYKKVNTSFYQCSGWNVPIDNEEAFCSFYLPREEKGDATVQNVY